MKPCSRASSVSDLPQTTLAKFSLRSIFVLTTIRAIYLGLVARFLGYNYHHLQHQCAYC